MKNGQHPIEGIHAAGDCGGSEVGGSGGVFVFGGGSLDGGDVSRDGGLTTLPTGGEGRAAGSTKAVAAAEQDDAGDEEEEEDAKRRRIAGEQHREVQRGYRERQKVHTQELEQKVAILQARLHDLDGGGGDGGGTSGSGGGGNDGHHSEVSECTKEKIRLEENECVRAFCVGVESLKTLVERGAADSDLRSSLETMSGNMINNKQLTPESNLGRALMRTNAALVNEAEEDEGAGVTDVYGSVCRELPKFYASVNTNGGSDMVWLGGSEAKQHWSNVVDQFEFTVPPSEVVKLMEWGNTYVSRVRAIYKRRQLLGSLLAGIGIGVRGVELSKVAGESLPLSNSPSDSRLMLRDPVGVEGQAAAHAPALLVSDVSARGPDARVDAIDSFTEQGRLFDDTLSILDTLKVSVAEELTFESEMIVKFVSGAIQARTVAQLILMSYPLLPDPVAVACELVRRRNK